MALTASFICSNVMTDGSYSISADLPAKFTLADSTPFKEFNLRSTLAEHEEHAMPTTGIVFFIIYLYHISTLISGQDYECKSKQKTGNMNLKGTEYQINLTHYHLKGQRTRIINLGSKLKINIKI